MRRVGVDWRTLWRRVWRNQRHPKVREERFKALSTFCTGSGIALVLGALAGPLLNPAQLTDGWMRFWLAALGFLLILAAQALLGYIIDEDREDD